jgi:3-deoxy-D-manno-octulosonate 8-phosphate phosphatase (KDO 8-P phosphatase)
LKEKIKQIEMILFDVDGVLCNGDISYLDNGSEVKTFNVQDGLGITLARLAGLKTGIISGRKSTAVERRAGELQVDVLMQGNFNKLEPFLSILEKFNMKEHQICYMGDDLLDLPILNRVGFSVAVANAREDVKADCDYITVAKGGKGAVREVIDLILKRQNKYAAIKESLKNRTHP